MRVAVIKGGRSLERQVSLRSGARVEHALERLGHEPLPIDAGPDLVDRLGDLSPDVAFVAMHGQGGEDGTVQELLEILGIPYTGSGVLASIRCADKALTKHLLVELGIPTAEFFAFNERAFRELGAASALPSIEERLGFPLVVKPATQGSALGIKFAAIPADVPSALVAGFSYGDKVVLERYIKGRDLAVGILDIDGKPTPLPIVEAVPKEREFYDFESRYEIGKTDFFCPADLSTEIAERAGEIALETFTRLGCRGFGRIDLMLDEQNRIYVLEAHTIPGLTETSLLPQAAEAAGVYLEELVDRILGISVAPRS